VGIWDETHSDWSTGEGLAVRQLFERAYADRLAARTVAEAVGIDVPPTWSAMSHTEMWSALLTVAARDRNLPALAAELLDDPARSFFATPLRQVLGDQIGLANAAHVAKRGFPASEVETSAVVQSMDPATVTAAIVATADEGQLQAINNAFDGSVAGLPYVQSLMNATRRVGLIRQGLTGLGSGFLVGPDLLLTAAHVIRRDKPPQPGDAMDAFDVVMDYNGSGEAVAETGTPVRVKELLRASLATDPELAPGPLPNWDAPDDHLDYALLRLVRAVGHDETPETASKTRGWYTLSPIEPNLTMSTLVMVWHFPKRSYLKSSLIKGSFMYNPDGTKTRMRYKTDTEPGSSGGPIIDEQGRLLGMHHRGQQPANQAVPIWRIAAAVEDLLVDAVVAPAPAPAPMRVPVPGSTTRPYEALLVANRPVVNRDPLRGKLWAAMTASNPKRSLVIVGNTDTGVSWSWLLVDHLAAEWWGDDELKTKAPHGIKAVKIDLRKDIAGPVTGRRAALIRAISVPLASQSIADDWPAQVARQINDFKDWCRRQLPLGGPQWWIFVDSIDEKSDLEQHGVGEVLTALADLAYESQVNLRLVLAGRQADKLDHESLGFGARDTTVGMSRQEVKTWLEAMAKRAGRAVDSVKLAKFLDSWFTTSPEVDDPVRLTLALGTAVEDVSA
jgi:Trypsin-like peptidase domain